MTKRLQLLFPLLEKTPDDPFLFFAIAKEYEGMGDLPQAMDYYQRLRALAPDYVGLYYHQGKLFEQMGDIEQAFATYTAGMAVAQKVKDGHAFNELAGAKLGLGDED